ncbi:relaxase/mobilization nuclease domain-containing protein [Maribellus comscasis]|uniref:Relaxase/mobilization nuclease domain-containing protein n=1 Tax=Maribellus comscasis TaxID=2681766 RepID=A0A6I6JX82_9BACT|nr:conjugal transfer protein MobB [Maribellus comscasis]QGY45760.1 relaxase/mobilization nuclease domain-containing protein [Maribellus comscasis]
MVAKISSGSSLYSALAYNQHKMKAGVAKVLFTSNMVEPMNGKFSIGICTQSFEPYLLANNRTENPVIHISLNPDPKDKLNDEQFAQIAEEYMQKLGYGNQPFVVYKHEDIDRHHIHIVSVKVDETGKMIRDNFQHRLSMRICRELERKYGLIPADEKQKAAGYSLKAVEPKKGNIKQQIANVVRPVARSWHFQSFNEYKALLAIYNVHVAEVKGEHRGKLYKGLVYAALNNKGDVYGTPIKSSKFGKQTGSDAIQKRIEKSKVAIKTKNLKERPKAIISKTLNTCSNRKDFEKQLLKNQISVLFRENESGRIYGVTFIDHRQKFVFNGSRLGKDFSANVFHEKFNGNEPHAKQEKAPEFVPPQSTFTPDSTLENLVGLLAVDNRGENPEEEEFIRRIKRKKRRKRKQ